MFTCECKHAGTHAHVTCTHKHTCTYMYTLYTHRKGSLNQITVLATCTAVHRHMWPGCVLGRVGEVNLGVNIIGGGGGGGEPHPQRTALDCMSCVWSLNNAFNKSEQALELARQPWETVFPMIQQMDVVPIGQQ